MPTAPLRVCAVPGCGARQDATRCRRHERVSSRNHRGIPLARRGYDRAYRQARAALLGQPCALRLPGCTGVATTADHVIPVSRGGAAGPLRAACAHCNSARGADIRPPAAQDAQVPR